MNTYEQGTVVTVKGSFVENDGTPIDPSTVEFKFKDPNGVVTTYLFGTDSQLVKDGAGNYHVNVDADVAGEYFYHWRSTGNAKAATKGSFLVSAPDF